MTEHDPEADAPLTAEERAIHAAWKPLSPPPDFAERVLAQADGAEKGLFSRPALRVGLPALTAIAAAAALVLLPRSTVEGSRQPTTRETIVLGDRGVAVAEPGSALSWKITSKGEAEIAQASGDVFYRVEPGARFTVQTSEGDVEVAGTCFRVEEATMKAMKAGAVGAIGGAAVAALVTVTVYEGQVNATSKGAGPGISIGAGERGKMQRGAPVVLEAGPSGATTAALLPLDLPSPSSEPKGSEAPAAGLSKEALYQQHLQLTAEAEALRKKVKELEEKVGDRTKSEKSYDISPEELKEMAARCELRWDSSPFGNQAMKLQDKDVETLHLSAEERELVDRLFREDRDRLAKSIASIYGDATGDPNTGSLATSAMFQEIMDKAEKGEEARVHQLLSRERAGLVPPQTTPPKSPLERLTRLMTSAGDDLESRIAKELGASTAHALRDLHNGWGSVMRTRTECPGGAGAP